MRNTRNQRRGSDHGPINGETAPANGHDRRRRAKTRKSPPGRSAARGPKRSRLKRLTRPLVVAIALSCAGAPIASHARVFDPKDFEYSKKDVRAYSAMVKRAYYEGGRRFIDTLKKINDARQ